MHFLENLKSVLAKAAEAALIVDESGTVLLAADRACQLLQYHCGDLDGQSVEMLIPERFRMAHIGQRLRFTDHRASRPMGTGLKLLALCQDGSELPVDIRLTPIQRGLQVLTLVEIRPAMPDPPPFITS